MKNKEFAQALSDKTPDLCRERLGLCGICCFFILVTVFFFCLQRAVPVQIRLSAPPPGGVQVYYRRTPAESFSQDRCLHLRPTGTPAVAEVSVRAHQLCGLRFDFGSAPGDVTILGGMVGDYPLPKWKEWRFSSVTMPEDALEGSGVLKLFSDMEDPYMSVSFRRPIPSRWVFRRDGIVFLLVLVLLLAVAFAMRRGLFLFLENNNLAKRFLFGWSRPLAAGLSTYEGVFLIACMVYYTAWIFQPFNFSPDEAMRFGVTRFLFEHGRLPVNEEAIYRPWGISYAHTPTMFCNVFGALFMKIGALFTSNETSLLRSARMLGVLCITGTVFLTIRTSKLLFKAPFNWLMVCIVAFLPQFAFIGSYVNNDSAALLGVSMILFAWVAAMNSRWNYRKATALAVGIAICATSYYNSYSWILFSMLMFPLTHVARNGKKGLVKMGLFILVVSFVLGGYLFLRHLHVYGDLLGFATTRRFAMKYADPSFVPGVRMSPHERGCSLPQMLLGMKWLSRSASSFVGFLGKMQYPISSWCYASYATVFVLGGLGALWKGADWIRGWRRVGACKWALLASLAGCVAITIGLSVLYSFTCDFEPQGRYCFPALLPIALLSAKGIERIDNGIAARRGKGVIAFALCLLLGLVSESSYLLFRSLIQ